MAAFNRIDAFSENLAEKLIDLSGNGLKIALTNTAHTSTWDELADLTEISYTNLSSRSVTVTSSSQTSGTYKLVLQNLSLAATGDAGPFRYIYLYDDNSTGDKLICYWDYGSSISLISGDSLALTFDSNGALTITPP